MGFAAIIRNIITLETRMMMRDEYKLTYDSNNNSENNNDNDKDCDRDNDDDNNTNNYINDNELTNASNTIITIIVMFLIKII